MFETEPSVTQEPDADTALEACGCGKGGEKTTGLQGVKQGRGQKQVSNRQQKRSRDNPKERKQMEENAANQREGSFLKARRARVTRRGNKKDKSRVCKAGHDTREEEKLQN